MVPSLGTWEASVQGEATAVSSPGDCRPSLHRLWVSSTQSILEVGQGFPLVLG